MFLRLREAEILVLDHVVASGIGGLETLVSGTPESQLFYTVWLLIQNNASPLFLPSPFLT